MQSIPKDTPLLERVKTSHLQGFAVVPRWLVYSPDHDAQQVALFAYISGRRARGGVVWLQLERAARGMAMHPNTLRKVINRACDSELGWLVKETAAPGDNRGTPYRIAVDKKGFDAAEKRSMTQEIEALKRQLKDKESKIEQLETIVHKSRTPQSYPQTHSDTVDKPVDNSPPPPYQESRHPPQEKDPLLEKGKTRENSKTPQTPLGRGEPRLTRARKRMISHALAVEARSTIDLTILDEHNQAIAFETVEMDYRCDCCGVACSADDAFPLSTVESDEYLGRRGCDWTDLVWDRVKAIHPRMRALTGSTMPVWRHYKCMSARDIVTAEKFTKGI